MRAFAAEKRRIWLLVFSLGLASGFAPRPAVAQSLTSGSLRGTVQTADGSPVAGASVTIETRTGQELASLSTDPDGAFAAPLITPGEFRILVEQIGFQPVRVVGVLVTPGATTTVAITLEQRPPPITTITEVVNPGARSGGGTGVFVSSGTLGAFDRPLDLSSVGRVLPVLVASADARGGFGIAAGGLAFSHTRLFVDGVQETLLRHPGLRAEPPSTPVFARSAVNQLQVMGPTADLEWRAGSGSVVAAQTRSGGGRLRIAPYATFSAARLGQRSVDNPGDSAGTSFQLGAVLSAAIVPDTARILVEGGYESLAQPSPFPWAHDSTRLAGQPGSLRQLVTAIGNDNFGAALARYVSPTVRTWKGGHAQARVDWQLGARNQLAARVGFASWKEANPLLGADLFGGTASALSARDVSGAAALTTAGEALANELRLGVSFARRDWTSSAIPGTILSGEGIGFGTAPVLPGLFDTKHVEISDALQLRAGSHRLKGGLSFGLTSYQQSYRFGSSGLYLFGDLDQFAAGTGTFFQVTGPSETARFTVQAPGMFLQDTWSASPEMQIQVGARFDLERFPTNKIAADSGWITASGIPNDSFPKSSYGISPRASFLWDIQNRGEWIVQGSGGLYRGSLDAALFAEAILFDGAATVKRGLGSFDQWPALPSPAAAPVAGKRLTLFSPRVRLPRTSKFELGLSRGFGGGTSLSVGGSYSHTDFLLRREDLNRADAGTRTTVEGRPLFGTLVKQGGLVTASPGSNRRFGSYDLVSGLAPTGFVDHYELTASLERRASEGLSFDATYTYGKTNDNLVGLLQADPADQLDPFPTGLPGGGDWSSGRSDLDVTHRTSVSLHYRAGGRTPLGFGARWRWRSGLPFTPSFRPGVDLNADGAGNNDPVFVDQELEAILSAEGCATPGGGFAERNSCREPGAQALDLRLSVGLPVRVGSGGGLTLTVDAFNVVSSKSGVVDRAAQLVDPSGALVTGPGGAVAVPFLSNPNFGSLLSRRGEPRLIRFGLRMEY